MAERINQTFGMAPPDQRDALDEVMRFGGSGPLAQLVKNTNRRAVELEDENRQLRAQVKFVMKTNELLAEQNKDAFKALKQLRDAAEKSSFKAVGLLYIREVAGPLLDKLEDKSRG